MKKKYIKIFAIVCLLLSISFCPYFLSQNHCHNTNFVSISTYLDILDDLQDTVDNSLGNLDEESFDKLLDDMTDKQKEVFGEGNFTEKIKALISGEGQFDIASIFSLFLSFLLDNLKGIIPILATICAIAIISSLLLNIRGGSLNKPLGDIIHFACYAVIVVMVTTSIIELISLTSETLSALKSQMEVAFPILLTLMAGLGANVSVSIYQPLVAVLCGAMMFIFTQIVLPIFALSIIFNIIGNLTGSVKITKMTEFFKSLFMYILSFSFTIFTSFLAISGIVAGGSDGISIRATKFAIRSYIPIMGGYLSDGFSLIMASSVLIKNAIGYSGLILMFITIISPLLKITLYKLGLKLVAGIIEPIADNRITNYVSSTAKNMDMLNTIILAFSFAYLICVGLMMCTSNIV